MSTEEVTQIDRSPDAKSAMEKMKSQIEEIAKERANQLISEAQAKCDQILEEANKEAEATTKKLVDEARSEAEKKKVQEVSRRKLNIKMEYLQSREAVIDEIFESAKEELAAFTKSKDYKPFLTSLVKTSAISLGGGDLNVEVRSEDKTKLTAEVLKSTATAVSKETGEKTTITVSSSNLKALGGLKVVRADNKLFADNTFEKILERSNEEIRVALLDKLAWLPCPIIQKFQNCF